MNDPISSQVLGGACDPYSGQPGRCAPTMMGHIQEKRDNIPTGEHAGVRDGMWGKCTHLCAMCAPMCARTFACYINEKSLSAHIAHIFLTHCYREKTAPHIVFIEGVMRSDVCMCANPEFALVYQRKVLHT